MLERFTFVATEGGFGTSERGFTDEPGVYGLVEKTKGWRKGELVYTCNPSLYITGNPDQQEISKAPEDFREDLKLAWRRTQEVRGSKGDFNGSKVALRKIAATAGGLVIETGVTDYFTLWGIPQAVPQLHQKSLSEMTRSGSTEVPLGIATQNILLTSDEKVVFLLRAASVGFFAGRLVLSLDEQMDPSDQNPFDTSARGYLEELGLEVDAKDLRLLGISLEKTTAYSLWCFVTKTKYNEQDIRKLWKKAKDFTEANSLFCIPINDLDRWMSDKITPEIWRPHDKDRKLAPDSVLALHSSVPWRQRLLKEFLYWKLTRSHASRKTV